VQDEVNQRRNHCHKAAEMNQEADIKKPHSTTIPVVIRKITDNRHTNYVNYVFRSTA